MTGRRDGDGNLQAGNIYRTSRRTMNGNEQADAYINGTKDRPNASEVVHDALQYWLGCDDGGLKLRRAADSNDLHITWTWSLSDLAGTYVYVRVPFYDAPYGLALLRTKKEEAENGTRKSTRDKRAYQ